MSHSLIDDSFQFKHRPEVNISENVFTEQMLRPKRDYELEDALSKIEEK